MEVRNLFEKIKEVLSKIFGKSWSLRRAEAVAEVLLQASGGKVQEVLVFGSIARLGDGNDLGMIAIVDPGLAFRFASKVNDREAESEWLDEDTYFDQVDVRYDLMVELLGLDSIGPLYTAQHGRPYSEVLGLSSRDNDEWWKFLYGAKTLDIFLLPPNWQSTQWVRSLLPCNDTKFFDNIARDTRPYLPDKKVFKGMWKVQVWGKWIYRIKKFLKEDPSFWWKFEGGYRLRYSLGTRWQLIKRSLSRKKINIFLVSK